MGKHKAALNEARAHAVDTLRNAEATGYRAAVIGRTLTDNPVRKKYMAFRQFRFQCQCGKRHSLSSVSQTIAYLCDCASAMRFEAFQPTEALDRPWRFVGVMAEIEKIPARDSLLVEAAAVAVRDLK